MKYTFRIAVNGAPAEKLVLVKAPSELAWHLVLKVLGYVLHVEEKPRIEESAGWHYKPDLLARDAEGRVSLWIDCGNIAVKKIDRVATKIGSGRFVILRRDVRERDRLATAMAGKVAHPERVELIAFDPGFVDVFADWLDATNDLASTRAGDELELVLENRRGRLARKTRLHRRVPA